MIALCYICDNEFEINDDEFLNIEQEIDEQVCSDCCEAAILFWHNLNLN